MGRGDVWWWERPDGKRRPVVVLTREMIVLNRARLSVAECTRHARGLPTEVSLDEADGMPQPCVVSLDNVVTAWRGHLTRRITTLGPERMAQVCEALKIAVAC